MFCMINLFRIFIILIICICSGCASTAYYAAEDEYISMINNTNSPVVYLYRIGGFTGGAVSAVVEIDGIKLAEIGNSQYVAAKVPPGNHDISVYYPMSGHAKRLSFSIDNGERVCFVHSWSGFAVPTIEFVRSSCDVAASQYRDYNLVNSYDSDIYSNLVAINSQEKKQFKSNKYPAEYKYRIEKNDNVLNKDISLSDESKIALVIGNSSYISGALINPSNDAKDVSAALRSLGFEVIEVTNASLQVMDLALRDFFSRLKKTNVGVFYYAGHGIQVDGRNFLIPVDAVIDSESDIQYKSMDVNRVLGKMQDAENAMNIVILDACRNNPFIRSFRSASRGLARLDAPTGTIVAYSTSPGSVASDGNERNGLYTKYLLKYIATPGLDINDVFINTRLEVMRDTNNLQVPWESSSLTGNYYFSGK